jgi:DNA/RNA endonuclease G, NUC1
VNIYKHFYKIILFLTTYDLTLSNETLPLTQNEINISISTHLKFENDSIDSLLIYRGFIVNYNYKYRIPNFTIHLLTKNQISNKGNHIKRRSNFFVDDNLLKDKSSLNIDYKNSGYDRGHMVPAGDFYWQKTLKNETFVMTNIAPQNPNLNRGIWRNLEERIRMKVSECSCNSYVITGTIIQTNKKIGINNVGVPDLYYKIIYFEKLDIMYAFLFDNNIKYYQGELSEFQVTVDNLELITKYDFFDLMKMN